MENNLRRNILDQIDALDARAAEHHANENVRAMFRARLATINNTNGYLTGNRVLDCRSIQMVDPADWIALFGANEPLKPYMQRCMDNARDPRTAPYAGELEVSLLLEENANPARPGTHRAVFLVFVTPHRQFETGHIIEVEYGEGSNTQQAINRIFHVDAEEQTNAVAQQFTEYQLLAYLSDEQEMINLRPGVQDTTASMLSMWFYTMASTRTHLLRPGSTPIMRHPSLSPFRLLSMTLPRSTERISTPRLLFSNTRMNTLTSLTMTITTQHRGNRCIARRARLCHKPNINQ